MKKKLITLLVLFLGALGATNDTVRDGIAGGFNAARGFATVSANNPCSTYLIPEAASKTIDWNNSCTQQLVRNEPLTISSFSGGVGQGRMFLILTASVSSPGAITWPASIKWASVSQNAPTLGGASKVDIIQFFSVTSGSYYGQYITGSGKSSPQ